MEVATLLEGSVVSRPSLPVSVYGEDAVLLATATRRFGRGLRLEDELPRLLLGVGRRVAPSRVLTLVLVHGKSVCCSTLSPCRILTTHSMCANAPVSLRPTIESEPFGLTQPTTCFQARRCWSSVIGPPQSEQFTSASRR